MRIILKPGGLLLLTTAFSILVALTVFNISRKIASRPGVVLVSETNSGSNATMNVSNWTNSGNGEWQVFAVRSGEKQYCQGNPSGDLRSTIGSTAWKDYSVYTDFIVDSQPHPGGIAVLARAQDNDNFYQLEINTNNGNHWELHCCKDNKFVSLASGKYAWSGGKWYTLRLRVLGNQMDAFVSEDAGKTWTSLGGVTDNTWTQGKVGLKTWDTAARFAHFRVVRE
jgi:hypothetical protein